MLEPLHPQAEWGNLGWRLLPRCILNTLPNSVHFAFDGEVAFWVFLSRDADLMDCDFSPDLLFKKKKEALKKQLRISICSGKKKNLLAIQALDFPGRLVYLPAKMLAKGKHICYRSEIFILFWAEDPKKNFI